MTKHITHLWPLFLGLFIIGIGVGAQGSLVGLRASMEGFDMTVIGLVMSGYFAGFIIGAKQIPRMMKRVGHVRTFAAVSALSSIVLLLYPIVVDAWVWFLLRLVTGFALSGIYIVAESWLNHAATSASRGKILSLYSVIFLIGLLLGQFMITLADPGGFKLFSVISALISLAAIPILVTATPTPVLEHSHKVRLKALFIKAPLGVVGIFLAQFCAGVLFGMGPVFGNMRNLGTAEIAMFMAAIPAGAIILQWPIGMLSDKVQDRRTIVALAAAAAAIASTCAMVLSHIDFVGLLVALVILGGTAMPLYSLTIAVINDFMHHNEIVGAAASATLVGGVGSALGPYLASLVMGAVGSDGFFYALIIAAAMLAIYSLYRIRKYEYVGEEERAHFAAYTTAATGTMVAEEAEETTDTMADINAGDESNQIGQ